MNDLYVECLNMLPAITRGIIVTTIILVMLIPEFVKKIAIPAISFFLNKIINREKSRIYAISKDNSLNEEVVKECHTELMILAEMELVQSADRKIGVYFYELINLLKHIVSYNKFKRLYPYLYFINNEILINDKKIKNKRYSNYLWAVFCFIGMAIFSFLYIYSSTNTNIQSPVLFNILCLLLIVLSELSGLITLNLVIKKKEIDEFNHIKNLYHERV
ncbi:hypothetical protein, partial [Gilliamella sp. Nev5-1]|uniref:hypothetical protein n=1 Tax=Gilliamella sp. Nev5-1 TaxID=3120251 RepID=UPI00117A27A9